MRQTGAINGAAAMAFTTDSDGVSRATIGDSNVEQTLELEDAILSFPPGAIAVGAVIEVETAVDVADASVGAEVGLESGVDIWSASPAVAVTAGDLAANQPFAMTLALGDEASLLLASEDKRDRLIVVYRITTDQPGVFKAGIIPNQDLSFSGSKITFSAPGLGVFQLAYASIRIEKAVAKETSVPIVKKREEKALPTPKIEVKATVTDERAVEIKMTVEDLGDVATCAVIIDEDRERPYSQVAHLKDEMKYKHVPTNSAAHWLYVRASCVGKSGRSTGQSEWVGVEIDREEVEAPAASTPPTFVSLSMGGPAADLKINSYDRASVESILGTLNANGHTKVEYALAMAGGCSSATGFASDILANSSQITTDGNYQVCVRLGNASDDITLGQGPTITVDTLGPTVGSLTLAGAASDGTVLAGEVAANTDLATAPSLAADESVDYALLTSSSSSCPSATYSASIPTSGHSSLSGGGSGFSVCARVSDSAGNLAYAQSSAFSADITMPSFSSVTLTGPASDSALSSSERSASTAIISSVSASGYDSLTYTIISSSGTCTQGGLTYSSTAPLSDSNLIGADGNYVICVRLADAAGNVTYGQSSTLQVDTTSPPDMTFVEAVTGYDSGEIDLNLDFSPSTSDYYSVDIRRSSGASAPSNCTSGIGIYSSNNYTDRTYTDTGLVAGTQYSYRICVYDAALNVTSGYTLANITAGQGTYGSGNDGNASVTSSLSASSTAILSSGRPFSASVRVESQLGSGPYTLGTSAFSSTEFAVGDKVFWIVLAAGASASTCYTNRGSYGFATVTARDANAPSITIDNSVTVTPNALGMDNASFCLVQLVRVPQLGNLTIDSGGAITSTAFDRTTGEGGVLVIQVNNTLTLNGGISATGAGFASAAVACSASLCRQGDSPNGAGIFDAATANGSGGAGGHNANNRGGGGGANYAAGGQSNYASGNSPGGSTNAVCGGPSVCAPSTKMFMGGAGGALNNLAGGSGGGIVFVMARQVTGTGYIMAKGNSGADTGLVSSGGGGGGTLYLWAADPGTSAYTLYVSGGSDVSASPPTYRGGGGGAGVIEYKICTTAGSNGSLTAVTSGGSGATAGSNGGYLTGNGAGYCP